MDEGKEKKEVPLCNVCHKRKAYASGGLCRRCWNDATGKPSTPAMARKLEKGETPSVPKDLAKRLTEAKSTEDWVRLANSLSSVIQGVADGTVKATAAQTAMLKDIMARAYGKPVATQQEKRAAAGIVILPALDSGEKMMICPRCGYNVETTLEK